MFWFRRKYNLPPNDPRLLSLTVEDIEADYWAHKYYEQPASDSAEDDDFDLDALLAEASDEWEDVIDDGKDSDHR